MNKSFAQMAGHLKRYSNIFQDPKDVAREKRANAAEKRAANPSVGSRSVTQVVTQNKTVKPLLSSSKVASSKTTGANKIIFSEVQRKVQDIKRKEALEAAENRLASTQIQTYQKSSDTNSNSPLISKSIPSSDSALT